MITMNLGYLKHEPAGSALSCVRRRSAVSADRRAMNRDSNDDAQYQAQRTGEAQRPMQGVGSHGSWHMHNEQPQPTADDGEQLAMQIVFPSCISRSIVSLPARG